MKLNETNLQKEFGERLVTLRDGRPGLRGGLHCEVRSPEVAVPGAGEPPALLDFIATDETLDRYNELIRLDGWRTDNYLKNPVVPDCHNYYSIAAILGRTVRLEIAGGKMVNRVEFALDNPLGAVAYKLARGGFIQSESVGFIPLEWTNGARPGEPDRTYTRQELLEISLVVVPANPGATIGAAVRSGAVERGDLQNLAAFLKTICGEENNVRPTQVGASVGRTLDARLLRLMRGVSDVLGKARSNEA